MSTKIKVSIVSIFLLAVILTGLHPQRIRAELISPSLEGDNLKNEPLLVIETPKEFCKLERPLGKVQDFNTGYEPGLKSGTSLMALFVPCRSLEAAEKGNTEWLPEWFVFEKNTVTFPSDNSRTLGTRGAVKQLCKDARLEKYGHPTNGNRSLPELVVDAHEKINLENPVIFFGVIGEEDRICYLSSLRLLFSPSGKQHRFLLVTAFMQAGDRWIYQTLRREVHAEPKQSAHVEAASILEMSKTVAQTFIRKNL